MISVRTNSRKEHVVIVALKKLTGHYYSVRTDFTKPVDHSLMEKACFLASVGNPLYEDAKLKNAIKLFKRVNETNKNFKRLDVLMAGTLQRHHFWNLSKKLSNEQLARLSSDISPEIDIEGLAATLAKKFYSVAKKVEDEYYYKSYSIFKYNLPNVFTHYIPWSELIPNLRNKDTDVKMEASQLIKWEELDSLESTSYDYAFYYELLQICYKHNKEFRETIDTATDVYYKKNKAIIEGQAKRIIALNPSLAKFFQSPNDKELAKICCRNYILEECPLLFPVLSYKYLSLLSSEKNTEPFKATQELCSSKITHIEMRIKEEKDDVDHGYSFGLRPLTQK